MASAEHRLISRVIRTGGMAEALDYGITEEDFLTIQCKGVWQHLVSYYKHNVTRNSTPSTDAFLETFSQFVLTDDSASMTTKALCYELRKVRLTLQLQNAVTEAITNAEDPVAAAITLRQISESIIHSGTSTDSDVRLTTHMSALLDRYEKIASGLIKPVMYWPWEPLQAETGGVNDEDYALFYGRMKSKKTFVLDYLLARAYEQGTRALCYTKEMTPIHMLLRVAAFLGRLPYRETRLAKLTDEDRATLYQLNEYIQDRAAATGGDEDLIVLSGQDANGKDNVDWLRAKIKQYKPRIVFIDGLYLLHDGDGGRKAQDWQRIMNISRDIRQLILETHVPVMATMQANRQAAKHQEAEFDEIAYSDAVAQDITLAFRVVSEKTSPTIALIPAGARDHQLKGIRIHGVPCSNFEFHSLMDDEEVKSAKNGDDESRPGKRKPKPKIGKDRIDKMLDDQLEGFDALDRGI